MKDGRRYEDNIPKEELMGKPVKDLVVEILLQTKHTNGQVAQNCKDIEHLKSDNYTQHEAILEVIEKNKTSSEKETDGIRIELKDTVKGKWFKVIAGVGTTLLIAFNVWDRIQQYYIGQ